MRASQSRDSPRPPSVSACHAPTANGSSHVIADLLDGKQFDTSYKDGEVPFSFRLNKGKVISGWEGIAMGMKVGQRVVVLIPPAYAYGEKGIGPIPPNSPLIFYMELVELGNIKGDKPRLPGS